LNLEQFVPGFASSILWEGTYVLKGGAEPAQRLYRRGSNIQIVV
jgi:hypothetical protein